MTILEIDAPMTRRLLIILLLCAALPGAAQDARPAEGGITDASGMEAAIHRTGAVALHGISFDTGTATLQSASEVILAEIVKLLKDRNDWRFEVQGHTDNAGEKASLLILSAKRAATVVEWLTRNGIDASRLVARGYGDTAPLADNGSEGGRARNRRVELKKLNDE